MEWKNDLRRTQSVRSIPSSCDKPAWTATGLRDRAISVSQLVARYQTEVEVGTQIGASTGGNAAGMTKPPLSEMTPPSRQSTGTHLESPTRKNEVRELVPAKANLTRSKSTGSLQSTTRSIEALKTLFETKSTAKNKVKSDFKAAGITPRHTADVPVMNGEAEDVQLAAEQQKVPAGKNTKKDAKEDHERKKVVNQIERRKTIGGVDFEKIRASEADEKRRSIADFRNSSFIQTKETLSVSVKAMSALYLSKVANQESKQALSKPMAEDSQQRKDDVHQLPKQTCPPGTEDIHGAHSQQLVPSQLSKEKLYQQRQKCELRRLLKHTHPELRMLEDAVDEEFAEILSSESATAGETGYEGEVLSRCLLFENPGLSNNVPPCTPKIHMAGAVKRQDFSETAPGFDGTVDGPCTESAKGFVEDEKSAQFGPDLNRECEDEVGRDVKQGGKVEMRERKGQTETEFERRQRLSVHMDEIMRGNMTTAMEIFDNLRKQEQLQSILSRVEEIEQDTTFISIQSAARKRNEVGVAPPEPTMCPACRRSPKPEEKFRTTKTVTCNSPAQKRKTVPTKKGKRQCNHSPPSSNREVTVLQVQTDSEGNSIAGTITENYERADNFGNRFHSSKTSNVVDILPETPTTSQAAISPANYQVAPHPKEKAFQMVAETRQKM
ncbi:unnamed protein product [Menidia menidia]|uniref:(Atlantic silverside) hypothetical protein n=1 Tax=Menidia menidia TaxID=238744 RepID=A0A8S4ATS4_9TELE|nr:unnamed protein product [Menidia menidia]